MNGEDVAVGAGAGGMGVLGTLIWLAVAILMIVAMWKVFVKAGQPGWASIIPIYNAYVFLKIAGKPGWWLIILLLVPVLNIIFYIIALAAFAQNFGKGVGFVVGLILLPVIFYPILAFSDARYIGTGPAPVASP